MSDNEKIARGSVLSIISELDSRDAEIERLREVIKQVRELLNDGTLIRDTSHDWDDLLYVKQGLRITKMVAGIREALGDE